MVILRLINLLPMRAYRLVATLSTILSLHATIIPSVPLITLHTDLQKIAQSKQKVDVAQLEKLFDKLPGVGKREYREVYFNRVPAEMTEESALAIIKRASEGTDPLLKQLGTSSNHYLSIAVFKRLEPSKAQEFVNAALFLVGKEQREEKPARYTARVIQFYVSPAAELQEFAMWGEGQLKEVIAVWSRIKTWWESYIGNSQIDSDNPESFDFGLELRNQVVQNRDNFGYLAQLYAPMISQPFMETLKLDSLRDAYTEFAGKLTGDSKDDFRDRYVYAGLSKYLTKAGNLYALITAHILGVLTLEPPSPARYNNNQLDILNEQERVATIIGRIAIKPSAQVLTDKQKRGDIRTRLFGELLGSVGTNYYLRVSSLWSGSVSQGLNDRLIDIRDIMRAVAMRSDEKVTISDESEPVRQVSVRTIATWLLTLSRTEREKFTLWLFQVMDAWMKWKTEELSTRLHAMSIIGGGGLRNNKSFPARFFQENPQLQNILSASPGIISFAAFFEQDPLYDASYIAAVIYGYGDGLQQKFADMCKFLNGEVSDTSHVRVMMPWLFGDKLSEQNAFVLFVGLMVRYGMKPAFFSYGTELSYGT